MSRPIEIPERHEIQAIIDEARDTTGTAGHRDAALISFLYCTGLRISEALAATPRDLTQRDGMDIVNVRRGKGGRQGWSVVMPDRGERAHWMAVRAGFDLDPAAPIFCTISRGSVKAPGRPLDRRDAAATLSRLAAAAGVHRRVHLHGLRHAHAVALFEAGAPVATIQNQLRHASVRTTWEYLRGLGCVDTARVLAGVSWS